MILDGGGRSEPLLRLAGRLLRDVFDAGLVFGHSVRTTDEACRLACRDATIGSSLVESRYLAGSRKLFDDYLESFRRRVRRRARTLMAAFDHSRREERSRFGETVYLLEPNLKRSRGGLRDLQLLRWIGMARYAIREPAELRRLGFLSAEDEKGVGDAAEYLLQLRNELHFHAGKPADVLDRAEQLRIAELRGYQPVAGMLPVEQFMRDYFRHTAEVSHVVERFTETARAGRGGGVLHVVFGRRIEGGFHVGPTQIRADKSTAAQFREHPDAVLRLVELAALHDKQIAPDTWEAVRREARLAAAWSWPKDQPPPPQAVAHFLTAPGTPAAVGRVAARPARDRALGAVYSRLGPRPGTAPVQPVPQVHRR